MTQLVKKQIKDSLFQTLEAEFAGVEIYRMALLCAKNEASEEEWTQYLTRTGRHIEMLRRNFEGRGLDAETRHKAKALLSALEKALKDAECVVDAGRSRAVRAA